MIDLPDSIRRLRDGKREFQRERIATSLTEKMRQVVGQRRPLAPRERLLDFREE